MAERDSIFEDESRMRREEDAARWRARGRGLWRWLTTRRAESWLFFVAGVLAGRILF